MESSSCGIDRKPEEEEIVERKVRRSGVAAIASGSPAIQSRGTPSTSISNPSSTDSNVVLHGSTFSGTIKATGNAQVLQGNVVNNYALCQNETRLEAWLKSLAFDDMDRWRAWLGNVTRAPGTCQWLFETEEFKAWEGKSGSERGTVPILMLKGKPGSGKSVLLNATMKRFESLSEDSLKDIVTLGFFFNSVNGTSLEQTIEGLYRSLIHQLLKKWSPHRDVNSVLEQFQRSTTGNWDIAILKDVFMSLLDLAKHQRVYIFLDALDECLIDGEGAFRHIGDVVQSLHKPSTSTAVVRTCLTVRSEAILENYLDLDSMQLIDVKSNNMPDIEAYIKIEVNKIRRIQPDLREQLPETLIRRCANMFLWARLVIERIRKQARPYWREQDIFQKIESLPTELHGLYEALLRTTSTQRNRKTLILLQILQVTIRPLTVIEVQSALSYAADSGDSEESSFKGLANLSLEDFSYELYDLSGGLVEITTSPQPPKSSLAENYSPKLVVQFIHKSVTDFLRRGGLGILDSTLDTEVEAYSHRRIANICMRLLDTPEAYSLSTSEREVTIGTSFLPYASQFWTLHARRADNVMSSEPGPPTNLVLCQTQVLIKLFRKFNRARVYNRVEDIPNLNMLTCSFGGTKCSRSEDAQYCQDNLLVLLAFEGCAWLFDHHALKCRQNSKCHSNRHVLERAFLCAVHRGWIQTTRSVWDLCRDNEMELNVDMYLPSEMPFTALYIASFKGKTDVVEFLLQKGADPLKRSKKPYMLPLHAACAQGYIEVVRILLKYAESRTKSMVLGDVSRNSERGWTVLHLASSFGHSAIVEELLDCCRTHDFNGLIHARTERKQTAIEVARKSMEEYGQSMVGRKERFQRIIYKLEEFAKGTNKEP